MTVISVNYDTIKNLAEDWITKNPKSLANHWIQFQILEELIEQCRIFSDYANRTEKIDIAKSYKRLQEIFVKILRDKKETITDPETRDDNLYSSIATLERILNT